MESLAFAVLMAVTAGIVALVLRMGIQTARRWKEALATVADELGLTYVEGGAFAGRPSLTGVIDGVSVVLDAYTVSTGKSSTTYTRLRVTPAIDPGLELNQEGLLAAVGKALGARDLEIGDPHFDQEVRVRTRTPNRAVASLHARARARARSSLATGATLDDGTWKRQRRGMVTDPEWLSGAIRSLVATAKAVAPQGSVGQSLTDMATSDPIAGVRLRALEALVAERVASDALLEQALRDREPRVRLCAAIALGTRGAAALEGMLDQPGVGAEAAVARARLALPRGPELQTQLEAALLAAAQGEPPNLEAIDALGSIGTVAAVPGLLSLVEGAWPGGLQRRARSAVRSIQSRIEGADRGQVSVAEPAGGGVSLASEAGRLSAARRRRSEEQ